MSRRHRTTMKMHRVSDKQREGKPTPTALETAAVDTTAVETTVVDSATTDTTTTSGAMLDSGATQDLADQDDPLTVESLGRYLATEASLREESEQRTSAVLTRYLKLTLAMACLNMVVAAVSVAALLRQRDKAPIVIATPPAAAPAPLPATPAPLPAVPPVPPENATVLVEPAARLAEPPAAPTPPRAVSPPARPPLLGPLVVPPKHAPAAGPSRATRVASKPAPAAPAGPITLARNADEEDTSSAHRAVERW